MEAGEKKRLGSHFAFERFAKNRQPVFVRVNDFTSANPRDYHKHDFVQVWYCYDNFYFHKIQETEYRCEKGSIAIIPAGTQHEVWFEETAKVQCLNVHYDILLGKPLGQFENTAVQLFSGDFLQEIDPNYSFVRMLSPKSQDAVEKALSWFVLLDYEMHSAQGNEQIWEKLEEIFALPEFSMPERKLEKALHLVQTRVVPIMKIVSYLNDHYDEKVTDEKLLQVGNISRAVMYRYFKRLLGDTYSVYLQKLRVRRAHLYMKSTTLPITQIAQLCGFSDVCHMTRVYTKYRGSNPKIQRQWLRKLYQDEKI